MIRYLFIIFIFWRITLFIFAAIAGRLLVFTPRFPYSDIFLFNSGLPSWFWSFANFDGVHYLTILSSGYSAQFTQVFFPLLPIILKIVSIVIPLNNVFVGIMTSSLFFGITLVMFYKLLSFDYSPEKSKWIILFLIFFPTSFFFGSLYTESLFMFLIVTSFYFARKGNWWLAGILGGLASGTRLVGIFLLPALLWEWHIQNFQVQSSVSLQAGKFKVKETISRLENKLLHFVAGFWRSPILYIVPLGLILYMLYLQINFGDFLYFWHAQPVFGAQRSGSGIILLPQVIFRYLKILTTVPLLQEAFWISLLEFLSLILVVFGLIIAGLKKVRISYLIFSWFAVIVPTLTGTFSSMPRYILVAMPIFIILGQIEKKLIKLVVLMAFFLLQFILTVLFTSGHWVS